MADITYYINNADDAGTEYEHASRVSQYWSQMIAHTEMLPHAFTATAAKYRAQAADVAAFLADVCSDTPSKYATIILDDGRVAMVAASTLSAFINGEASASTDVSETMIDVEILRSYDGSETVTESIDGALVLDKLVEIREDAEAMAVCFTSVAGHALNAQEKISTADIVAQIQAQIGVVQVPESTAEILSALSDSFSAEDFSAVIGAELQQRFVPELWKFEDYPTSGGQIFLAAVSTITDTLLDGVAAFFKGVNTIGKLCDALVQGTTKLLTNVLNWIFPDLSSDFEIKDGSFLGVDIPHASFKFSSIQECAEWLDQAGSGRNVIERSTSVKGGFFFGDTYMCPCSWGLEEQIRLHAGDEASMTRLEFITRMLNSIASSDSRYLEVMINNVRMVIAFQDDGVIRIGLFLGFYECRLNNASLQNTLLTTDKVLLQGSYCGAVTQPTTDESIYDTFWSDRVSGGLLSLPIWGGSELVYDAVDINSGLVRNHFQSYDSQISGNGVAKLISSIRFKDAGPGSSLLAMEGSKIMARLVCLLLAATTGDTYPFYSGFAGCEVTLGYAPDGATPVVWKSVGQLSFYDEPADMWIPYLRDSSPTSTIHAQTADEIANEWIRAIMTILIATVAIAAARKVRKLIKTVRLKADYANASYQSMLWEASSGGGLTSSKLEALRKAKRKASIYNGLTSVLGSGSSSRISSEMSKSAYNNDEVIAIIAG